MRHAADSANARSEAIAALELALGRFANAALERAKEAESALRRTTSQLEDRRNALRRRLIRLREEIDNADDEDDTSHAQRQCEETEDALSNIARWQGAVEEAAVSYQREASKLQELSTQTTAEARAALRQFIGELQAYFALQAGGTAVATATRSSLAANAGGDALHERDQIRAVAALLISTPGFRRDAWNDLATQNARLEVLQEAENGIAGLVGRPALTVLPGQLEPQEYGVCDGETIWVNDAYLEPGANQEMIRTIVHEGRHAFQYYVCNNPAAHDDDAQVEAWRSNLRPGGYVEWKENPARYMSQPVEADAFAYEDAVMSTYISEGGD